jgi:molybdopterin molybdotransferase
MISVDQAYELVTKEFPSLVLEEVTLEKSLGRVLVVDILADRDGPPFDRVTMDGIAIRSITLESQKIFKIESMARAGEPQKTLFDPNNAIEVMTGAPLPIGCDTVIRYEDLKIENGIAKVDESIPAIVNNIHFRASDFKKGEIIVARILLFMHR